MAIYVGVNGVPKKVKNVYVGVNGAAKKTATVYAGNNGTPKVVYKSTVPAGEKIFTSSGTFTVPDGVTKIDVFCVGGGGAGGGTISYNSFSSVGTYVQGYNGGSGGGGGYTTTVKKVSVTPGDIISVSVGSAGTRGTPSSSYYYAISYGNSGGNTSISPFATGNGGSGGWIYAYGGLNNFCKGGSAGGIGSGYYSYFGSYTNADNGGSDGSGPTPVTDGIPSNATNAYIVYHTVSSQGTTTRYFGESNGTLYAGGGGGAGQSTGAIYTAKYYINAGYYYYTNVYVSLRGGKGGDGGGGNGYCYSGSASNGSTNTGGGGGGGSYSGTYANYSITSGYGGSGIAIIRWEEQ